MSEIYFKIREISTGLFSTGGSSPRYTNQGKVWHRINHLNSHLNASDYNDKYEPHDDYEIVSYEVKELSAEQIGVQMKNAKERREQRLIAEKQRHQKWMKETFGE